MLSVIDVEILIESNGIEWNRMEWNRMESNRMESNGMEWNGIGSNRIESNRITVSKLLLYCVSNSQSIYSYQLRLQYLLEVPWQLPATGF